MPDLVYYKGRPVLFDRGGLIQVTYRDRVTGEEHLLVKLVNDSGPASYLCDLKPRDTLSTRVPFDINHTYPNLSRPVEPGWRHCRRARERTARPTKSGRKD